ncbi:endo-1,4-beta-xylanase [Nocardia gamkensis]|uniref:endo-1,4-beta-xylanase n=1 Tax=Nocardia gamkensis TaxID=352869 RepID=UPI0037C743CD
MSAVAAALTLLAGAYLPAPADASVLCLRLREPAGEAKILIGSGATNPDYLDDPQFAQVLSEQFNSLSPENELKWSNVEPQQGAFDFTKLDRIVDFAGQRHMAVKGHGLISGAFNPPWLEQIKDPNELRAIIKTHFQTIMTRYAGKVDRWDVATEVFSTFGGTGLQQNYFYQVLGPDYLAEAFRIAHEAAPTAKLFLNESLVESYPAKRQELHDLISDLVAKKVPITGVGLEMHLTQVGPPSGVITDMVNSYRALGLEVAITEMDVHLTPDANSNVEQGKIYGSVITEALAAGIRDISFWGFTDKHAYTWVPGAKPLMFDEDYNPKPAFFATWAALANHAWASPQQALGAVQKDVQKLVNAGALDATQAAELTNKLDSIVKQLDMDKKNSKSAASKLQSAIKFAEDLVDSGKLSREDGQGLLFELNWALSKLN